MDPKSSGQNVVFNQSTYQTPRVGVQVTAPPATVNVLVPNAAPFDLTELPEPGTWTVILSGLALLTGLSMLRRRTSRTEN